MLVKIEAARTLIIERSRQLVETLIDKRGHDSPPFLPEELAHLMGIKEIIKEDIGEVSAVIIKLSDGHKIKVNSKQRLVRQNFSIAHEIGHILFSELNMGKYIKDIATKTFNPHALYRAQSNAMERLCDIAATELLMPDSIFRKYLLDFGISINSVEQLADIFMVSVPAAAIRIAEVSPDPCIALLWRRHGNKSRALRLAWPRRKPLGKSYYPPVHTRITPPSTLHKAYECNSSFKCYKVFKINNIAKNLPMESKGFGYGENRYVLSLAFLNKVKLGDSFAE